MNEIARALESASHKSPHDILGLFHEKERSYIRVYRPDCSSLSIEVRGQNVEMTPCGEGLFECDVSSDVLRTEYKVSHWQGLTAHDPYCFQPRLTDEQKDLFAAGDFYDAYKYMGGRLAEIDGVSGASFAVWAPHAEGVSLVADFNHFDKRVCPMKKCERSGIWELFVPGLTAGEKYKFCIRFPGGGCFDKADPFELYSQMRPETASVLYDPFAFPWDDTGFSAKKEVDRPINIYEVHLGSWKRPGQGFPNYKEIAEQLAPYCVEMGYTHVEVMPVSGHPLDESWGYQVTGYFGVTSRYGTPDDFRFFVNHMHEHGLCVILDWVPAHFPKDDFSFATFDGRPLYEHEEPLRGHHPQWGTSIFDYGKGEVVSFLLSSALYYAETFHIDGIRVDAVSSIVFLDYERKPGEWIPNIHGGNEHLEGIAFLMKLNRVVHERCPHVLMIAEESHAFPKITKPTKEGGLGFNLRWNLGWMNDTLRFFSRENEYRTKELGSLQHTQSYMYDEQHILVLSHDEVVHMKGSVLGKMPKDHPFAHIRQLYTYMMTFPGKKLLFMGGEFAMQKEWDCKGELEWGLISQHDHAQVKTCVHDLNHLYKAEESLWRFDFDARGFTPIELAGESLLAFYRKGEQSETLIVHNFLAREQNATVVSFEGNLVPLFCSAHKRYGGEIETIPEPHDADKGITIVLPPLASIIYRVE